jgi:hypothetical protein
VPRLPRLSRVVPAVPEVRGRPRPLQDLPPSLVRPPLPIRTNFGDFAAAEIFAPRSSRSRGPAPDLQVGPKTRHPKPP